ncbi:MMPL family transporter [Candidatus Bipolaricaulota bacterium]|nr:MMPL family transporter [Candidatus Bipolaricaulota bacterium]
MKSPIERLLEGIFRIGRYRAWWVVVLCLAATGAGVYYSLDSPFRGAFLDLLPVNEPLIDEYRENEKYTGDAVGVLFQLVGEIPQIVDADDDLHVQAVHDERDARLVQAAEAVASILRENEEFTDVYYLRQISENIPDQYIQLFNLKEEQLQRIEASVELARGAIGGGAFGLFTEDMLGSEYASIGSLDQVYELISTQFNQALMSGQLSLGTSSLGGNPIEEQLALIISLNDGVLQTLGGLDELPSVTNAVNDLSSIFMPDMNDDLRAPQPLISGDHMLLLLAAQPRYPSQRGVEYSQLITGIVQSAIDSSNLESLGVLARQTGTYSFNTATTAAVNKDMLRTTIISSIGVFVIFILAFGSFFYSVIAVIPLLVSVVLTMAWAKFAVDGFNLVTTFLPALVLGLGIDYAIHIISRYAEERNKGRSLNRALHTAILSKGKASLYAAVTTSLVFVGLLTARSRALFEMGAITSVGVMLAFFATLFLVPALISLSHFLFRIRRREGIVSLAPRLSGFFQLITGRARAFFVIILILTFFVTFQAARTSFEFSSTDLIPRVESQEVAEILQANFANSGAGVGSVFTFYASTGEELRTAVAALTDYDRQWSEYGLPPILEAVESPLDLLPVNLTEQQEMLSSLDMSAYIEQLNILGVSLAGQANTQAHIRTVLAQFSLLQFAASANGQIGLGIQGSRIIHQLRELQQLIGGLDVATASLNLEALRAALAALDSNLNQVRDLPPVEELLRDVLLAYPEALRAQAITSDGRFVIQARVSREIFDGDNMERFNRFASSFSNDYFGMPLVVEKLEGYMKRDFYLSTGIAILVIIIIVWGSLRGWMRALLATAPLVLGYIWMLGGMRLMDMDFNFLSITISPLLIGIGVDNGIHIIHRTMEEKKLRPEGAIERGVGATAISVIVTSLTTMLVFASLMLARTPGLRMLGASALLGIGFTLLFSLLFLPAALKVEGGKRV